MLRCLRFFKVFALISIKIFPISAKIFPLYICKMQDNFPSLRKKKKREKPVNLLCYLDKRLIELDYIKAPAPESQQAATDRAISAAGQ